MQYWFAGHALQATFLHQKCLYIYVLLKNTFLHDAVRQNFLKDLSFTIVPLKILLWVFSLKFEVNLRLTAHK